MWESIKEGNEREGVMLVLLVLGIIEGGGAGNPPLSPSGGEEGEEGGEAIRVLKKL